ncbi:hypothetical protein [Mesorhizobium sp. B2-3-4]|uniref:hypothetical protein n=1 Tax=Mesorhizobium sp. B2-3-4 TaxID=2589959 RepID=UPI00112E72EF|nr:hypothetical protein [Mesorhizobium sp. B2-3-4]TPM31460.1 hypothetical protein FJ967_24785 [Mesorhizobium sp. B2-3-4]
MKRARNWPSFGEFNQMLVANEPFNWGVGIEKVDGEFWQYVYLHQFVSVGVIKAFRMACGGQDPVIKTYGPGDCMIHISAKLDEVRDAIRDILEARAAAQHEYTKALEAYSKTAVAL